MPFRSATKLRLRLEFLIALLGAFAAAIMAYSLTSAGRQDERHHQLLLQSTEIQQRMTLAHLWLEQGLSGDMRVRPERDIFGNLDATIRLAKELAARLERRENASPSAQSFAAGSKVDLVVFTDRLIELRRLAGERWQAGNSAAAGTAADAVFDRVFAVALQDTRELGDLIQSLVDGDRVHFARLQLLVLLALLFLFAGIIGLVFQNRREERQRQVELERNVEERTLQLREANENLARAARLKDEFLAAMSHELRTPLNAILGFNELLLEGIQGELNAKQAKSLGAVDESARHLLSLINDILDLSKIEAGQERLTIERTAMEPVCQASVRFVRQLATKKGLTVVTELDPRVESLPADERRLRQILINLLSNAVKFTPEGGRIGLEVALVPGENTVRFTVWDTGIGISEEDRAKLFKPFVQLDSRLSRQYSGTGLGLSLVMRLSELHGGRVSLESEPGKGSRFSVFLPAASAPAPVPAAAVESVDTFSGSSLLRELRPTVLVVEDNPMNQEAIQTYLTSHGCQVTIAKNGVDGLVEAERLRPDVILMDIQMPDLDGYEATRILRTRPATARTPIFALTALAMNGDRERCLAAGANEYLSKPVNLRNLADCIARYTKAARSGPSA